MTDVLTVDPGDSTGWAFWSEGELIKTGQITGKKKDVMDQYRYMWHEFYTLIQKYCPDICLIEGIEIYSGSIKSHIAIRKRKGKEMAPLVKLAYLIGGYVCICLRSNTETRIVPFSKWGGQLSPLAVRAQVAYITGKEFNTQHIFDAVGMGLNYYGKL